MTNPYDPAQARQLLAETIQKQPPERVAPILVSDWIAMSCLQKAVRRGQERLALRSAARLLETAPDRLWRRCCGIAFEDIGVADLRTVSLVSAGLSGKRFRASVGGEWAVASALVSLMSRAPKCRAADDLLMTAELHPIYELARLNFASLPPPDLLRIAMGSDPLPVRAIAAWYAAGTGWWNSRHLVPRRGEPSRLFSHFKNHGVDPVIVDLAETGFKKGAGMLGPFVAMLSPMLQTPCMLRDDEFPPEALIGGVPGWALDIYSREGRARLEAFLLTDSGTARWVRTNVPQARRMAFLGGLLFRVEGGLVRHRLQWDAGADLRKTMDVDCHGSYCTDATETLQLMRRDIRTLNEVRAIVPLS